MLCSNFWVFYPFLLSFKDAGENVAEEKIPTAVAAVGFNYKKKENGARAYEILKWTQRNIKKNEKIAHK